MPGHPSTRAERRKIEFSVLPKREELLNRLRNLRLGKARSQARKKVRNVAQVEFLERDNAKSKRLNKARQHANETVPFRPPKFSIGYKNDSLAVTTSNITRTPANDRRAPDFTNQYVSVGNVRQRRRSIRKNFDQRQARIMRKILSSSRLFQANSMVVREVLREMGFKATRVMDIAPQVTDYLKRNYPSIVGDFIGRKKIKKTRILEPLKIEWNNIWRDYKSIKERPNVLRERIAELESFLTNKSGVEKQILDRYYSQYDYLKKQGESKVEFMEKQPEWKQVMAREKELSAKYNGLPIDYWRVRQMKQELETAGTIPRQFVNRLKSFMEDLEFVRNDKKLHGEELRKLLKLPVVSFQ